MQNAARKVVPSQLGRPKIRIEVAQHSYCHAKQATIGAPGEIVMATTWNATQTFNHKGQPSDKDND
jgi:hypothetical protein